MAIRGPAGVSISNTGILLICVCVLMLFVYTFRGSISESAGYGSEYGSKYDREYKVSEVLSAAIFLSEKAGRLVKDIREKDALQEQSKGETKEGVNDPLTEGDLMSHRILVKGFMKAFPALNLVSEEHEEESVEGVVPPSLYHPDVQKVLKSDPYIAAEDITVWVDPLDATKEYTERLTQYVTVMACVAVKGVPVAGVIRKPFDDKTYWAWVDHGVSDSLQGLHGSEEGDALEVIVSLSHKGEVEGIAKKAFAPKEVHITGAGGAGYKVVEVIRGTEDVYVHTTLIKKWDICAGDAILRAIGGTQTDLRGDEINYSHELDPKNEHGLIATMHDHEKYRQALAASL